MIEPTIIERGAIALAGFSFFGDPFSLSGEWTEENEIGRLWQRLMAFMTRRGDQLGAQRGSAAGYEVHIEHEETAAKGHFEVFVGVEVSRVDGLPVELLVKVLPPTRYAVFTLAGQQIVSDWPRLIYSGWLPGSGYQVAHPYNFQLYDDRFKGFEQLDESVIDVYVPVKPGP